MIGVDDGIDSRRTAARPAGALRVSNSAVGRIVKPQPVSATSIQVGLPPKIAAGRDHQTIDPGPVIDRDTLTSLGKWGGRWD